MTRIRSRRQGFSLIELMAVMAIIALLAAITAGGINRVRAAQMSRNTEQTVTKLQLALDQQWKAIADQVMQDKVRGRIPTDVFNFCGKDIDKAAALWMYIQTRREFPQTFAEAIPPPAAALGTLTTGTISITGLTNSSPNVQPFLQMRQTFSGIPSSTSLTSQEQAASLLYLILSEKGSSGTSFAADDGTQGAQGTVGSFRVFVDAWRTPISFVRYAQNTELDQSPYIRPGSTSNDPLDPTAKLVSFGGSMATAFGVTFSTRNRQPAVISAGPNKGWDGMYDMDNIVGYRLRREGNRGD